MAEAPPCYSETFTTDMTSWSQGTGPFANQQFYFPASGRHNFPVINAHRIKYTCLDGTATGLMAVGFYTAPSTLITPEGSGANHLVAVSPGSYGYFNYPVTDTGWNMVFQRNDHTGVSGITSHVFRIDYYSRTDEPSCVHDDADSCLYGTRKKTTAASVIEVAPGFLGGLLNLVGGRWALAGVLIGTSGWIYLDQFCNSPPPADVDIAPGDFIPHGGPWSRSDGIVKLGQKARRSIWLEYCECVPATGADPPAVNYNITVWNQPSWYISSTTNNISNTDIANTLNLILNTNTSNVTNNYDTQNITYDNSQTITNIDETTTDIHGCTCPEYTHGPVHSGLTGTGIIEIGLCIGFEVQVVVQLESGLDLPGQPEYLWNQGWMSITNLDGMLAEKRVTRESEVWLPSSARLASQFKYTLRTGVELRVTELVAS